MRKKYKVGLIVISVLLLGVISLGVLRIFYHEEEEKREVNVTSVISNIDDYGYTLDDRDTDYMKEVFHELENILEAEEVDYEAYAKLLSELFVIDLFTMNNKINRYDVGSTEYVYPESVENFKTNVEDTIYKTMENNSNGKRKQNLPEVSSIDESTAEASTFTIGEEEYDSYVVTLSWSYEKNLGYDTNATITLVPMNEKLYVVEYVTGE